LRPEAIAKRDISFERPVTKKGDYVVLEAVKDVVVVMSACPQDILVTHGEGPTDAHFQTLG
jgi:uncharacterized protein YcgI (DUF1989 family)